MGTTLALQVDEGREWRRYASGSCQTSCDPEISELGNHPVLIYRNPDLKNWGDNQVN